MNTLIPGIFLVSGLALMLIDLIWIERKSISETLMTRQFFFPKKPLGIIGNIIVIISAIFLVLAFLGIV
jgi:hypothetical protein